MIGVATALPGYRIAVAELPARLRLRERDAQISVVRADADGIAVALRAVGRGARVIVVDRPGADAGDFAGLSATGVSVVLNRPSLRDDDIHDARRADGGADAVPVAVTVQALTARGALGDVLVDAMGWGRVLAGSPLTLRSGHRVADAVLADLAGAGGIGVGVVASERLGAAGPARLRATTIGVHRTEVVSIAGRTTVTHSTGAGEWVLPRRWESSERVALRRALDVLSGARAATDIAEWAHDLSCAAGVMRTAPSRAY